MKLFTTENRKNVTNIDDNRVFYQLKIDEEKRKRLDGLKTGVKDSLFQRLARSTYVCDQERFQRKGTMRKSKRNEKMRKGRDQ